VRPNAKSIRKAIITLLNNSELRTLSENARRSVIENFSFESVMRSELAYILLIKHAMKGGCGYV